MPPQLSLPSAVTGSIVSTTSSAEAKQPGWVWGVGAGIATAAVVGSAIAASNDPLLLRLSPLRLGPPSYNAFGQYVGRVRSCY
ncbi:hypothetical protein BRDID11002_15470 [Bradyrhizobium diazoefficiens]